MSFLEDLTLEDKTKGFPGGSGAVWCNASNLALILMVRGIVGWNDRMNLTDLLTSSAKLQPFGPHVVRANTRLETIRRLLPSRARGSSMACHFADVGADWVNVALSAARSVPGWLSLITQSRFSRPMATSDP
jgi:hypothetical protein